MAVDAYAKDLPIERVSVDALITYELNGAPLSAEHGFPVRLVVPGYYGTNRVKWFTRLTLAGERSPSPFATRWYNDPVRNAAAGNEKVNTPVRAIAPESLIVSPAPGETIEGISEGEIWGWAWADGGVREVLVRTGDTAAWRTADLEAPSGHQWQRFSMPWTRTGDGTVTLAARAESTDGARQPYSGQRNAIHTMQVTVR